MKHLEQYFIFLQQSLRQNPLADRAIIQVSILIEMEKVIEKRDKK
jgi:hypothetical protein